MNPVKVPLHLAIPALLSALLGAMVLAYFLHKGRFGRRKWHWLYLAFFFGIYSIIGGGAAIDDIQCQQDANKYDLNGDGFFSGNEITEEQKAALLRLTNDVGRNFAFITSVPYSLFVSAILIGSLMAIVKLRKPSGKRR